MLFSVIAD